MTEKPNDERSSKQIALEKRERASAEGRTAMAEVAARKAFVEKNTVRLRELRLAKESADREAEAAMPPKAVKKPKRAAAK